MYYTVRFIIMILLQLPQLKIPTYIYVTFVRPRLKAKETEIDKFLADMGNKFKSAVSSTAGQVLHNENAAAAVERVVGGLEPKKKD